MHIVTRSDFNLNRATQVTHRLNTIVIFQASPRSPKQGMVQYFHVG